MILDILAVLAPVIALATIGYFWARLGAPFDTAFATRLSMTVSVPCLLFATLARVELDPRVIESLALASLVLYGVMGLGVALMLVVGRASQRAFLAPLTFGNTGNIGLPVALFAFGEQGLAIAMIVFAVMAILSFTVGVWVVSGAASPAEMLRQPVFYAAALGGLWAHQGWTAPDWLLDTIGLIGQMAIPLMLLTLGVSISRLAVGGLGRAIVMSIAKLALGVAAALVAVRLFELEGVAAAAVILQAITPVAVTNYLLAAHYDAQADDVAGLVVVSTLLSAAALPIALALLL